LPPSRLRMLPRASALPPPNAKTHLPLRGDLDAAPLTGLDGLRALTARDDDFFDGRRDICERDLTMGPYVRVRPASP